jgi:hypothetical protein
MEGVGVYSLVSYRVKGHIHTQASLSLAMASEKHRALDHFFVAEWIFSCAYIQATNMTIALKHPIISAAISIRLHKNGL